LTSFAQVDKFRALHPPLGVTRGRLSTCPDIDIFHPHTPQVEKSTANVDDAVNFCPKLSILLKCQLSAEHAALAEQVAGFSKVAAAERAAREVRKFHIESLITIQTLSSRKFTTQNDL
jgi:hypothetical protein